MLKFADEHLDRAAEIYRANPRFARAGLHFEAFLLYPARAWELVWGSDVDRVPASEPVRPLLPRQARAQLEADFQATCDMLRRRQEAGLASLAHPLGPRRQSQAPRVRDGRFVQPTRPRGISPAWCVRGGKS